MKIKIITVIITLLLVSSTLLAEKGKVNQKNALKIKARIIVIVTEEPSAKLLKDLNDDELKSYKKDIEDYNNEIKEAATTLWKFTDKIEFKTREEMDKVRSSQRKQYAFIEYDKFRRNTSNANLYKLTLSLRDIKTRKGTSQMFSGGAYTSTRLNIWLGEGKSKGMPVAGITLPTPFPDQADMDYAIKAMQINLSYKLDRKSDNEIGDIYKTKGGPLAKLILLIDSMDTQLTLDSIKKVYPYPVEIVNKERIDEAIISADRNYCYLLVSPFQHYSFIFQAISTEDASTMACYTSEQNMDGAEVLPLLGNGLTDMMVRRAFYSRNKVVARILKVFADNVH